MKRYPLSDKVVLITGAGRGLGAATATALTRRGARVVIADIDRCTAVTFAATLPTGKALALECDVTSLKTASSSNGAILAPRMHLMRWKTTGSSSFVNSLTESPSTPVTRAKSVHCCPQRLGASTLSVLSGRISISTTPSPAFARRLPFT
jgi:2-polyprenyl-6-methoxyphenol hydroxylase-like FAD-dependent oxidoreductase